MHELSILTLIVEWLRHDPVHAFGLSSLACIAISTMTDFDLLTALGFVDVEEPSDGTMQVG